MESRIQYSARGTSRYDSWDMENLKYIRRKSQSNLLDDLDYNKGNNCGGGGNGDSNDSVMESSLETESYKSANQFKESDEIFMDDSTIYSGGGCNAKSKGKNPSPKSKNGFPALITSKPRKHTGPSSLSSSSVPTSSDDDEKSIPKNPREASTHKNKNHKISGFQISNKASSPPFPVASKQEAANNPSQSLSNSVNSLESASSTSRLDDCYVLDVVTVRNESVFADCKNNGKKGNDKESKAQIPSPLGAKSRISKIPVFIGGSRSNLSRSKSTSVSGSIKSIALSSSAGSTKGNFKGSGASAVASKKGKDASSGSSVSSIDEAFVDTNNSSNENEASYDPHQDVHEKPPLYVVGGSVGSRSSCSDLDGSSTSSGGKQRGGCPFCSDSSSTSSYYLGGKHKSRISSQSSGDISKLSMQDEEEIQRTPSPYYVRLRRDLCNYTPPLCTPRNFGMDKQGQLVIDYSQNWIGLESYIKHLQLI